MRKGPRGGLFLTNLSEEAFECFGILRCDSREDFAVESNTLLLQTSDERAVGLLAVLAKGSVQANNPELTEFVLLVAAVCKCLFASMHEGLLRCALFLRATMAIALSALEDVLAALQGHHSSFYSRHTVVLKRLLAVRKEPALSAVRE